MLFKDLSTRNSSQHQMNYIQQNTCKSVLAYNSLVKTQHCLQTGTIHVQRAQIRIRKIEITRLTDTIT